MSEDPKPGEHDVEDREDGEVVLPAEPFKQDHERISVIPPVDVPSHEGDDS